MIMVNLQHQQIICLSMEPVGMIRDLQDDEVDEAWTKEISSSVIGSSIWDDEW